MKSHRLDRRRALVRSAGPNVYEGHVWSYEAVVEEAQGLGMRVLDLDKLQSMLMAYAEKLKPYEWRIGATCQLCGTRHLHTDFCTAPGVAVPDA